MREIPATLVMHAPNEEPNVSTAFLHLRMVYIVSKACLSPHGPRQLSLYDGRFIMSMICLAQGEACLRSCVLSSVMIQVRLKFEIVIPPDTAQLMKSSMGSVFQLGAGSLNRYCIIQSHSTGSGIGGRRWNRVLKIAGNPVEKFRFLKSVLE